MKKICSLLLFTGLFFAGYSQIVVRNIPGNAIVVNTSLTNNGGFTPAWVCPLDTFHSDGGIRNVYMESGAIMTTGGGIDTIYVKPGAQFFMNGGIHVIYFVDTTNLHVSGGIPTYVHVPAIFFNYANAPLNGCVPSCALTASISPPGNLIVCEGQTLNISAGYQNANGPVHYYWSGGDTTASISIDTLVHDTLVVSDSSGCAAFVYFSSNWYPPIPIPSTTLSGSASFCPGDSVRITADSGYVSYIWSNGDTTRSILATQSGNYLVTVNDSNGCVEHSAGDTVTVHSNPQVSIAASNDSVCKDSVITLTGLGASTYLWAPGGDTTRSIQVAISGATTVFVTGTDTNGCVGTNMIQLGMYPVPAQPSVTLNGNLFTANPSGTQYQWYRNGSAINGANAQTYAATQSGYYSVVVWDANGCPSALSDSLNYELVSVNTSLEGMQIWPNPSGGKLNIEGVPAASLMEIFDLNGKCLIRKQLEAGLNALDAGHLAPGMYLIRVQGQPALRWVKE